VLFDFAREHLATWRRAVPFAKPKRAPERRKSTVELDL